jgi:hypothetical protein
VEDGYTREAPEAEIGELIRAFDAAVKLAHDAWGEDAKREYLERKTREWRSAEPYP